MGLENKISASLMCADPFNLGDTIFSLEKYKIDYLHIDIMDGKFVPNLGIGSDYIKALRKHTKLPFDYHIMVKEPDAIINLLDIREYDLVSVHYECSFQIQRTLENIKKHGCKVMIAINPATPLCTLEEVIYYIDGINLLMVNPGFAGQNMVENCMKKADKVGRIIRKLGQSDIIFEADGNISFENARKLKKYGANLFVGGTSSLFSSKNLKENILKLRQNIQE
ncbi:MAG: ribulose-phosphate 3-epimerase [Candidatus Gastranaerophilales bacterium]|nr:ribulose-phosphate 3-epimerase [Candidatus Gastranaerophilales bacterium]